MTRSLPDRCVRLVLPALLAGLLFGGCQRKPNVIEPYIQGPEQAKGKVPTPVDLLLPQKIRIHPFTSMRTFEESNVRGVEARIETLDAFGDPVKAFGEFRFELWSYRANNPEHKGKLLNNWTVSTNDARANQMHWDHVTRAYLFKLELTKLPEPEENEKLETKRYVLVAVFSSPYTNRLFAEHVISLR